MLKRLRDWVDHRYLEHLRDKASQRVLRTTAHGTDEEHEKAKNALTLIDAAELFCRLSRKIVEQRLDETPLFICMWDWTKLVVGIGGFSNSGEHDLEQRALSVLDRPTVLVRSHIQQLTGEDPMLAARFDALNVPIEGAKSWGEFKELVSSLHAKHFP